MTLLFDRLGLVIFALAQLVLSLDHCPDGTLLLCPDGSQPRCLSREVNPGGSSACPKACNPHSNACDLTAPTCIFPDPRVANPRAACACRPGYKATGQANNDVSKQWRLPINAQDHRVWVAEGVKCDTLCDVTSGVESCQEVTLIAEECVGDASVQSSYARSLGARTANLLLIDTSYYYRLTNDYIGPSKALDVLPDGSGGLQIANTGAFSGQYWRFVRLADGPKYALRTLYLGDAFSLDVLNDQGTESRIVHLTATGGYTGQYWTLNPWGDGSYRLSNDFTGLEKHLDVYSDTLQPMLDTENHSGQHWRLSKIQKITSEDVIPTLTPVVMSIPNEGPTLSPYPSGHGTLKVVMVFIDFSDAQAQPITDDKNLAGNQIIGNGLLQKLFTDQSYANINLKIDIRSDLPWHTLPASERQADWSNRTEYMRYVTAALASFSNAEVDFSTYDVAMLVVPRSCSQPRSYSIVTAGELDPGPASAQIYYTITFGTDIYNSWYIAAHELGHGLGLPDLYPYTDNDRKDWKGGPWGIMADDYASRGFLGWHRHKLGWLAPDREAFIKAPTEAGVAKRIVLNPLSSQHGVSLLAIDVGFTSKLLIAEIVQPLANSETTEWFDGVMVYTIDSTIATGYEPIQLVHNPTGSVTTFGAGFQAPWKLGSVVSYTGNNVIVSLNITQIFGDSYYMEISYKHFAAFTGPTEYGPMQFVGDAVLDDRMHH